MKKKMGFRCDNYYICLLVPPTPPHPLHHQTCCLRAILPTSSSADWQGWGTGAELHAARGMSEFDIAIFVICLIGLGEGVFVPVVYLFALPVWFKGYNMKVLISSLSAGNAAIGWALGCPQMLSHRDTVFILMINVCWGILYPLAPNRPVCSTGSVVRRLVLA